MGFFVCFGFGLVSGGGFGFFCFACLFCLSLWFVVLLFWFFLSLMSLMFLIYPLVLFSFSNMTLFPAFLFRTDQYRNYYFSKGILLCLISVFFLSSCWNLLEHSLHKGQKETSRAKGTSSTCLAYKYFGTTKLITKM